MIANGTEPTGGEDIDADIKTFSAMRAYARAAITANPGALLQQERRRGTQGAVYPSPRCRIGRPQMPGDDLSCAGARDH